MRTGAGVAADFRVCGGVRGVALYRRVQGPCALGGGSVPVLCRRVHVTLCSAPGGVMKAGPVQSRV